MLYLPVLPCTTDCCCNWYGDADSNVQECSIVLYRLSVRPLHVRWISHVCGSVVMIIAISAQVLIWWWKRGGNERELRVQSG